MRNKILVGVAAALSMAAIAGPAQAQVVSPAPAPSATQNAANSPQLHVSTCTVKKSAKGYTIANCPLTAINMGKATVYVQYHSSLKTFEPLTGGEFGSQNGIIGVPGAVHKDEVLRTYSLRFAFKNKNAAQIARNLKVTISNPTGGAVITVPTAGASVAK